MGILDQYKKIVAEEEKNANMDFPESTTLTESDKEAYEAELNKLRKGSFSQKEIADAIKNSQKNMDMFGETHNGGDVDKVSSMQKLVKISDEELKETNLLTNEPIKKIMVIRAYCPKCGKELIAKAPPMYNPFTMEKVCIHDCCGVKYNLEKTYPHIAFIDADDKEIISYGL